MDNYSTGDQLKNKVLDRVYRAGEYLSIYLFIIIVYSGALLSTYLILELSWSLLATEIETYPLVKSAFDYARIGLALIFIFCAVVHGLIATYSQIKINLRLAKEDDTII